MPPAPKAKKKTEKSNGKRPIIYDRVSIKLHDGNRDPLLTMDDAKTLLGWTEEKEGEKFGSDYQLLDENGVKIRLLNNPSNRPYRPRAAARVRQEILRGNWKLNLESMIIGETGVCLSCQHRLVGFVLACQEWEKHPEEWPYWKSQPTISCLIALGCSESDDVVNTLDTGEPRTLADVIYRTGYFKNYSNNQREQISKTLQYAVNFMWERTGEVWNPHSPYRTHAESLSFIDRHMKLVDCVNHIYVENGGNKKKISEFIQMGYAAGLMYVMGASETDPETYQGTTDESGIDFSNWDKAAEFWVAFASRSKPLSALHKALGNLMAEGAGSLYHQKVALIIKAWQAFVRGEPITPKNIALKYETVDGIKTFSEVVSLGGIDNPHKPEESEEEE